jgi:hypothetical protein
MKVFAVRKSSVAVNTPESEKVENRDSSKRAALQVKVVRAV